jgi:hypothetical protein
VFFYPSTELTSSIHALRNGDSTMNPSNELHWIDYLIIRIYFVFVLGIGFVPVNSRLAWSQSATLSIRQVFAGETAATHDPSFQPANFPATV